MTTEPFEIDDFDGISPLFPLPNIVHFPQTLLPLHIFEPRYRKMTQDALAADGFLTMARQLSDECSPAGATPQIDPNVCLGKIIAHERLADGRFYLVLKGLIRARVMEEIPSDEPYRLGRLELIDNVVPEQPLIDRNEHRLQLLSGFRKWLGMQDNGKTPSNLDQILEVCSDPGSLTDLVASAIGPSPEWKQKLLSEPNVDHRCEEVWAVLRNMIGSDEWPPRFSHN